jgi:hypothetical protein
MRKLERILILVFVVGIIFSIPIIPQSSGHGLGTEILPPVDIGNKKVSLEATAIPFQDPEINGRQIEFALVDTNTKVSVRDVTFLLKVMKGNEFLFEHIFEKDNGVLIMDLIPSESDQITIEEESSVSLLESLVGIQSKSTATGSVFKKGGLYLFEVQILTIDSYSNKLVEPIKYDFGLSFQEITPIEINDPNFGKQIIEFIAYYDQLGNFQYDPDTRVISFEMPFDWSEENINQSIVVHNEIRFSKSFGDLLVPSYTLYVNNIEMPQETITIDEFSEFYRIVHLIIPQADIIELNKTQPQPNMMQFFLIPNEDDVALSTVTGNGQFRVKLDWEPKEITSGSTTIFYFNILDVFLKNKPMAVSYEISLVSNGKTIDSTSGISTDFKELNSVEFFIPEDVSGPVTVQFDNLADNGLARVGLPVIVNRVDSSHEISIPDWVRNNAAWWAAGQIVDSDFVSGIEFMIKEGIIQVPPTEKQEGSEAEIPDWVRNNADWWADGLITDDDFASGLQFLISNGIISV